MAVELRLVNDVEPPSGEAASDFEGFFERESQTLFRRLWLVTRDRGEAEDIVQGAFIVIPQRWDRMRGMEDPTGYLYRVAFDRWRKRARRAARAVQQVVARPTEPPDVVASADA